MKRYHIINPAAGQGKAELSVSHHMKEGDTVCRSESPGDVCRLVRDLAIRAKEEGEEARFFVYGGDGTLNEAVNGIMAAEARESAILTAVPTGTGNDFVRIFEGEAPDTEHTLDLIGVDGGYALNMINIGFDCAVVDKTAAWKKKPLISGSLAYIMGVIDVLRHKLGLDLTVEWEDEGGVTHTHKGPLLLCAIANARFCGGGFQAAPVASVTDGLMDLLLVEVISRLDFIKLVSHYHNGTHVSPKGTPAKGFEKVLRYVKCRSVRIRGMSICCADGEILPKESVTLTAVPGALRYMTL